LPYPRRLERLSAKPIGNAYLEADMDEDDQLVYIEQDEE
jgi:hypothetical protein